MNLQLDTNLAEQYQSSSQKIRIITESWVGENIFCPHCGATLHDQKNNNPVGDFYCESCLEEYELKSKKDSLGKKINDGAYSTMIERLKSENNPSFFFLNYDKNTYEICNFLVIPKHFFVPSVIEKRKPLSSTARRAGWTGCNILMENIPQSGRIFYIKNREIYSKQTVRKNWEKTLFLKEKNISELKGWTLEVMKCIDLIGKQEFFLDDVYQLDQSLGELYPENKHVRDKIRQQLQILRDNNYLEFIGRGRYRLK